MEDGLIAINLLVGDRTYRVRIKPADEEAVRRTARIINDKILEFKTHFAGKDMQDYIAMVVLWYATTGVSGKTAALQDSEETPEKLGSLEALLDKVLQK